MNMIALVSEGLIAGLQLAHSDKALQTFTTHSSSRTKDYTTAALSQET